MDAKERKGLLIEKARELREQIKKELSEFEKEICIDDEYINITLSLSIRSSPKGKSRRSMPARTKEILVQEDWDKLSQLLSRHIHVKILNLLRSRDNKPVTQKEIGEAIEDKFVHAKCVDQINTVLQGTKYRFFRVQWHDREYVGPYTHRFFIISFDKYI